MNIRFQAQGILAATKAFLSGFPDRGAVLKLSAVNELELIEHQEAIRRITRITASLKAILIEKKNDPDFLPVWIWYLILIAQRRSLRRINDEVIYSPVSWNQSTGFPSHPSLIADAQIYAKFLKGSEFFKKILASLSDWTILSREKISCCCGKGWNSRIVEFNVLIRYLMKIEENSLFAQQLIGIQSGDLNHLSEHYPNFSVESVVVPYTRIVYVCENRIRRDDESIQVKLSRKEKADTFDHKCFSDAVWGAGLVKLFE